MSLSTAVAWRLRSPGSGPGRLRWRRRLAALGLPAMAVLLACATICLVLLLLDVPPVRAFAALIDGAFGNWLAFTDTLAKATPLIFTGLAVAVAFEASLYSIGAEGQLLAGALAAAAIGPHLGACYAPAAIALTLGAGVIAGAAWGGVCGWLRSSRGVNEVISTIMLNFVAAQLASWAVRGPIAETSHAYPASNPIAQAAMLHHYLAPSRLNAGMILALIAAVACWLFLSHTAAGFQLRAMGKNARAAAFFGVPIGRLTVFVMALSGALAGLAGAVQISAITHRMYEQFSPGWGYEAIAVALLARLHPLGVIVTALLFGALDNGAQAMQRREQVSPVLVQIIQALIILVLLACERWMPERAWTPELTQPAVFEPHAERGRADA